MKAKPFGRAFSTQRRALRSQKAFFNKAKWTMMIKFKELKILDSFSKRFKTGFFDSALEI